MVFEESFNHDPDFSSSTYVNGNNPPVKNMFPYEQTPSNLSKQFSVNYNIFNPSSQVSTDIGSYSNHPIQNFNGDPVLSNSSFSQFPVNYNLCNLGSQVNSNIGSSANLSIQNFNTDPILSGSSFSPASNHFSDRFKNLPHLNLSDEFQNFIPPNISDYQFSVVTKNDGDKMLGNFEEFCSSNAKLLCENGDRVLNVHVKEKNKNKRGSNNCSKGRWKEEEDRMLKELVKQEKCRRWSHIARKMGRTGKQIRDRYNNYLRPGLKKGGWSEEDEIKIIKVHEKMGNKWVEIAKLFPDRSENDVKNKWNLTKRRCLKSNGSSDSKPITIFESYVKKIIDKNQKNQNSIASDTVAGLEHGEDNIMIIPDRSNDISSSFKSNESPSGGDDDDDDDTQDLDSCLKLLLSDFESA